MYYRILVYFICMFTACIAWCPAGGSWVGGGWICHEHGTMPVFLKLGLATCAVQGPALRPPDMVPCYSRDGPAVISPPPPTAAPAVAAQCALAVFAPFSALPPTALPPPSAALPALLAARGAFGLLSACAMYALTCPLGRHPVGLHPVHPPEHPVRPPVHLDTSYLIRHVHLCTFHPLPSEAA